MEAIDCEHCFNKDRRVRTLNDAKVYTQGILDQQDYALNVIVGRDVNAETSFHHIHDKFIDIHNSPVTIKPFFKITSPEIRNAK